MHKLDKLDEFSFQTSRLKISGLVSFKSEIDSKVNDQPPIIAVHGWLDNAASFIPLSEYLDTERPFYAIELPGHGKSQHRPQGTNYHLVDNVVDLLAVIDHIMQLHNIDEGKVDLIGHSMGGIVCCLLAAAEPNLINRLILIDSLGPLTDELENVLPQLRRAVGKARKLTNSRTTLYPSIEKAIKVRQLGIGKVSSGAARLLCERGLTSVEGGYVWSSDSRLLAPSFVRFSEAQVEALFAGIICPVSLLVGTDGYFSHSKAVENRLSYFSDITKFEVQGGHHFHMDGDVEGAANIINDLI